MNVQFAYPSKMVAEDGKGYRLRKQSGSPRQCPCQQPPVLEPLFAQNAQSQAGTPKSEDSLELDGIGRHRRLEIPQDALDPLVVLAWRVNFFHDGVISCDQFIESHGRDNIGATVYIVPGKIPGNAMYACKAFKQPCSRRCLEHAHHGCDNAALLNEIYLALKNRGRIIVKTHDEATHNL